MAVSIFTKLVKSPLINGKVEELIKVPEVVLVNKFTEESAKKFYEDMNAAENSPQDIIPIFIDSYGGAVYSLLAMIDCIRSSKKKVATVVLSKAMSCGAILLSCGHEGLRFAAPTATVLIHDISSWATGKVEEIKVEAAEAERLNNMIYHLLDDNTGHEQGYYQKIVHDHKGHADWFLTPDEAKVHNLVNHIRVPKFEVTLSVETKFA